ncbi:MAG: hypothetical protein ACRDQB_11450 [Thermocrispum sp.]
MTRPAPARPLPLLLAATLAGAVALAITDAPQSLGLVFRIGIDSPEVAGEQLIVAVAGAVATAVAVLLAGHWRRLLPIGGLGVLVSHLMFDPGWAGITARVVVPDETVPPPAFALELPWVALGVAASGVLLVALLGAVQRLWREHPAGAAVAAITGCAAYLGPMVVGPLRAPDLGTARLIVLGLAVVITAAALLVRDDPTPQAPARTRIIVAGAVLFTVAPTLLVAVTGQLGFGSWPNGVVGLVVLAAGATAAVTLGQNALLAAAAVGLALAAPVTVMLMLADALVIDWAWTPQGLLVPAAVLLAAALAASRGRLLAAVVTLLLTAVVTLVMAGGLDTSGQVTFWAFLAGATASVALAVGSTTPLFAARGSLPAAGAVITTMALGVHCTLSFLRIGEPGRPRLEAVFGREAALTVGALLIIAAILLVLLQRLDRVRPAAPLEDRRRVFTATSAEPPETR